MTSDQDGPAPGAMFYFRAIPPDPAISPASTPRGMAEAVALLAGRTHAIANIDLADDVPAGEVIRALLGITRTLLEEQFPADHGADFLARLGADAVTGNEGDP